jgi:hypothetical protein
MEFNTAVQALLAAQQQSISAGKFVSKTCF